VTRPFHPSIYLIISYYPILTMMMNEHEQPTHADWALKWIRQELRRSEEEEEDEENKQKRAATSTNSANGNDSLNGPCTSHCGAQVAEWRKLSQTGQSNGMPSAPMQPQSIRSLLHSNDQFESFVCSALHAILHDSHCDDEDENEYESENMPGAQLRGAAQHLRGSRNNLMGVDVKVQCRPMQMPTVAELAATMAAQSVDKTAQQPHLPQHGCVAAPTLPPSQPSSSLPLPPSSILAPSPPPSSSTPRSSQPRTRRRYAKAGVADKGNSSVSAKLAAAVEAEQSNTLQFDPVTGRPILPNSYQYQRPKEHQGAPAVREAGSITLNRSRTDRSSSVNHPFSTEEYKVNSSPAITHRFNPSLSIHPNSDATTRPSLLRSPSSARQSRFPPLTGRSSDSTGSDIVTPRQPSDGDVMLPPLVDCSSTYKDQLVVDATAPPHAIPTACRFSSALNLEQIIHHCLHMPLMPHWTTEYVMPAASADASGAKDGCELDIKATDSTIFTRRDCILSSLCAVARHIRHLRMRAATERMKARAALAAHECADLRLRAMEMTQENNSNDNSGNDSNANDSAAHRTQLADLMKQMEELRLDRDHLRQQLDAWTERPAHDHEASQQTKSPSDVVTAQLQVPHQDTPFHATGADAGQHQGGQYEEDAPLPGTSTPPCTHALPPSSSSSSSSSSMSAVISSPSTERNKTSSSKDNTFSPSPSASQPPSARGTRGGSRGGYTIVHHRKRSNVTIGPTKPSSASAHASASVAPPTSTRRPRTIFQVRSRSRPRPGLNTTPTKTGKTVAMAAPSPPAVASASKEDQDSVLLDQCQSEPITLDAVAAPAPTPPAPVSFFIPISPAPFCHDSSSSPPPTYYIPLQRYEQLLQENEMLRKQAMARQSRADAHSHSQSHTLAEATSVEGY